MKKYLEMVKLTDICTPKQWKTIPTDRLLNEGYPVYGANGVIGYFDEYNHEDSVIAITCRGATCGSVNVTCPKAYITGNAMCLDDVRKDICTEYLYYCLKHFDFSGVISGSAQPQITRQGLEKVYINICEETEQKEIVKHLNKLETIIKMKKKQIEELETLIKSRFVEMFGDPVTNPMGWPVCELSEYIEFLTSGSRGWAKYFTDEGEYFITIKNVKNCHLKLDDVQYIVPPNNIEAKRTKVQEGDLLISITADLGRTAVISKEVADYGGYINQHLTCIRLKKTAVCPLYVAYYMESEAGKSQFQSKNQSAVKAGLNFNAINTLKLMVPSMELQEAFKGFVAQNDKIKATIQKSLDETQLLFDSLMQEYFG